MFVHFYVHMNAMKIVKPVQRTVPLTKYGILYFAYVTCYYVYSVHFCIF